MDEAITFRGSIIREVYNASMEASDTDGRRFSLDDTGATPSSLIGPGTVNPLADS